MGAESGWIVVYEKPVVEEEVYYGVTSEEAMQVLIDNGPAGAKPLYAYKKEFPNETFSWPWSNR